MSRSVDNFVLVKDRVPRSGKGVDNLLSQLGQYLRLPENKYVQKMVIDSQRIYLYFEKMVPKEQAPEEVTMSWHSAVRKVPMEEIASSEGGATSYLYEMFQKVSKNGYEACQFLVGSQTGLYKWADLPLREERLFGVPITKDGDIPDDVIILCGGSTRDCDPEEIGYSVKGTLP